MLPITNYREQIVKTVSKNYVTIIEAETGAGKSTQVPQYLAEKFQQVVVTEPRIMAAKTLAMRVAEEANVTLGEEVGYRTGYDKCSSPNSKILFATDGLQLVRTIMDENNQKEKVLVIDELHEWNGYMENLVAWAKKMKEQWNTKVVLMSATLDSVGLTKYFGKDTAVVHVPGTLFDVHVEERSEYELIPSILESIQKGKNCLVFVSGKKEISQVMEELKGKKAAVFPLHGEMDWEGQKKCFATYSIPKVIVATNIAQTSVTIPDIDVVIDTGKAKAVFVKDGVEELVEYDVSVSDIMQRKGRAGRTKEGEYILCSNTLICERKQFTTPEIQRCLLDRFVLQLSGAGLDAEELEFYHQPDKQAIQLAKKELATLGAFTENNQVTAIGRKMVKMPVSVHLARMIVEAEKYGVTEQVITIAAIVEMGGLLDKEGRYSHFTQEHNSDLLAELDVWNKLIQMKYIDFKELGIKKKNFFKIKEHIRKLKVALCGIVEMTNSENRENILRACLVGYLSKIYVGNGRQEVWDEEYNTRRIARQTCISCMGLYPKIVAGNPIAIGYKDEWDFEHTVQLLTFVSSVEENMICELMPDAIQEKTELSYDSYEDTVIVATKKYFRNICVSTEVQRERAHPEYAKLKAEYEKECEERERREREWLERRNQTSSYYRNREVERQWALIDGKEVQVEHGYYKDRYFANIDMRTLFTTEQNEVFLSDGTTRVWVQTWSSNKCYPTIAELRSAEDNKYIGKVRENKKREYSYTKVVTLADVISHKHMLGKVVLTMDRGGYGSNPVIAYGCVQLKKRNEVALELSFEEELANSKTAEALQFLFGREIETKYGDKKFCAQKTKKKNVLLTDEERAKKEDF